jgi:hypothetical protein
MPSTHVLVLPGWQGSSPAHWQSRWELRHGYQRVEQHDWQRPLRGDWSMRLEETLLSLHASPGSAVLVAHSLACHLVAAWAAHSKQTQLVKAALLVAPADVERQELRAQLPSWSPWASQRLPFQTRLLASRNDPFCSSERAQQFAAAWGSEFVDMGPAGHVNADSGLGDWPWGHAQLQALLQD